MRESNKCIGIKCLKWIGSAESNILHRCNDQILAAQQEPYKKQNKQNKKRKRKADLLAESTHKGVQ